MNVPSVLVPVLFANSVEFVRCVSSQSSIFPFGMNIRNTVMSGIQDQADFAVNIHVGRPNAQPPHEDLEETLKSLDGIMMVENAQRRADNEEFTEAEQRLLKIHRNKIRLARLTRREIVSTAFEPIHAMVGARNLQFPSRMEALIRNGTAA